MAPPFPYLLINVKAIEFENIYLSIMQILKTVS